MSDAFRHFEKIAPLVAPVLLVVPGVVCVLGGLCMWLSGLRWSKFVACLLGCVCGLVCAFLFTDGGVAIFVVVAIIWMFFGLIFDKVTVAFAGGGVVVMLCVAAFTWSELDKSLNCSYPAFVPVKMVGEGSQVKADLVEVGKQFVFFSGKVTETVKNISPAHFVLSICAGLVIAVGGFLKGKIFAAVSCSLMGTLLVFYGMILLLMYKGAAPLTIINMKTQYYGIAAAVMAIVGTAVQLMLCPSKLRMPKVKVEEIAEGDEKPKKRLRF